MKRAFLFLLASAFVSLPALAQEFPVRQVAVTDEKSVFATIESANEVPARARIGGTITALKVRQGDRVQKGQVIATVGDRKLGMQVASQNAQVIAAQKQAAQAKLDLDRALELKNEGYVSTAKIDQLRTAYDVAQNTLASLSAQEGAAQEQQSQGAILAPASGRVLTVPVTQGTVVMQGEAVATIADQDYVLRLSVPERHAGQLKVGDPVHADGAQGAGSITLVYPKIEQGRLQADAHVTGMGDYFVGERIRVWVPAGTRTAIVIPSEYILTHQGIDYAKVKGADGSVMEVPIQRGGPVGEGVEILSGLEAGDTLVHP